MMSFIKAAVSDPGVSTRSIRSDRWQGFLTPNPLRHRSILETYILRTLPLTLRMTFWLCPH